MASIANKRILKEIDELKKNDAASKNQFDVESVNDNLSKLQGHILGPPDTPYAGASFKLDITIPSDYPFVPPKVKFHTSIWHPNVSSVTGAICLDILKNQWAASMSLRTVLLSIQALLASPQPDDPQDAVVASQCLSKPEVFHRTARFWAKVYANGPCDDVECNKMQAQLVKMGFSEDASCRALSMKDWDIVQATEYLISSS